MPHGHVQKSRNAAAQRVRRPAASRAVGDREAAASGAWCHSAPPAGAVAPPVRRRPRRRAGARGGDRRTRRRHGGGHWHAAPVSKGMPVTAAPRTGRWPPPRLWRDATPRVNERLIFRRGRGRRRRYHRRRRRRPHQATADVERAATAPAAGPSRRPAAPRHGARRAPSQWQWRRVRRRP